MSQSADGITRAEAQLEALLAEHGEAFGRDAIAYGNHVRRVFALTRAQFPGGLSDDELGQLVIAAVYHDIAIWLDDTFDYLDPSADHAGERLAADGHAEWIPRVRDMIERHHQLHPVKGDALVEAFRRADLCDLSYGLVGPGIPRARATWRALAAAHPVAGFQLRLVQFTWGQFRRHPLRPLPMLRL